MKKNNAILILSGGLALAAAAFVPALVAAENGTLMDLTMRVSESAPGMPAIAPRTISKRMCVKAGAFDARSFASPGAPGACKTERYAKNGNVVTFDLVCSNPVPLTSHGEFHLTGGQSFTGRMLTKLNALGHPVSVETDYAGRPAGTCAYVPPAGH